MFFSLNLHTCCFYWKMQICKVVFYWQKILLPSYSHRCKFLSKFCIYCCLTTWGNRRMSESSDSAFNGSASSSLKQIVYCQSQGCLVMVCRRHWGPAGTEAGVELLWWQWWCCCLALPLCPQVLPLCSICIRVYARQVPPIHLSK